MKKRSRFAAIGMLTIVTAMIFQFMSVTTVASEKNYFSSMEKAAIDFAKIYNKKSIKENKEYGSSIYRLSNGKYIYTKPNVGTFNSVMPSGYFYISFKDRKLNPKKVANIHTHARLGLNFSKDDYDFGKWYGIDVMFMSNAKGNLYVTKKSEGWRSRIIADERQGIKHDKREDSVKWKRAKYVWNHWFNKSKWCKDCAD